MVDYLSYFQYGPAIGYNGAIEPSMDNTDCMCHDCRQNEGLTLRYMTRFDDAKAQSENWNDEQYMLCPPRVLGYILKEKQWAQLQVTSLKPIEPNTSKNPWSFRLRLENDKTKDLLFDLVCSHISSTTDTAIRSLEVNNIIPKKGKGLVILLYGMFFLSFNVVKMGPHLTFFMQAHRELERL